MKPETSMQVPLAPHARMAMVTSQDWPLVEPYGWYEVEDNGSVYAYANTLDPDGRPTTIKMHRLIMDAGPGEEVDHVNGNGLDNRRSNLRIATRSQNARNSMSRGGSSRFKGVYWYPYKDGRPRWRAQIRVGGKRKSLGYFDDEIEAARAYDEKMRSLPDAEFGRYNFPRSGERSALA